MPAPIRAPTFLSRRRLFEQKLADLHKCTDLNQLKQLHALIYKSNLHKDPFVAPKLISALSLCQQMALAINVFDQIQNPNAYLCNTLIKAYIRNSEPDKAFEVFREMRWSGIFPDNYTYLFLIKACSGLNSVKMIHAHVEKYNLYSDLFVPNSLIDAYSKCGLMGVKAAKTVFDVMEERDVVTYNSMISGLVKAGELKEAKKLFDEMPHRDRVSWNAILDGYVKAEEMSAAFEIFERMPSRDVVSWSTVISGYAKMGACRMHNAVQLAEEVLDHLVKLESAGPGNFSMLSNVYAAAGDWGSVSNARLQIRKVASKRPSGVSLIELNDEFHEFTVMDTTHPRSDGIYQTIKGLNHHLTKIPYAPSIVI
ncbi:Pentatricopeptide repeat-containing protein [Sesamum alatum]|uniref:Pentatricopeptide repeat-containing protein n=1 Tax=Sesamum alatum TaxID=300844 RepID=A0AAE1XU46_9LAMI|nr:Pentatricopeptide repeat-containing protein [Sesamum alatum]